MIVQPGQSVEALSVYLGDEVESTKVTCIAEPAQVAISTLTYLAFASCGQGDYVIITNKAGTTWAVWLDKDANGTAPTGAAYAASNNQIKVSITTGQTAAQVATAAFTAIGSNITNVTAANPSSGVVSLTQTKLGVVAVPVPHNTGDTGAGSIVAAASQSGVASALQNKYFVLNSASNAASYYAWANVHSEGTDPSVAAKTAIPVAISLAQTATQVAAAFAAAIDAQSAFAATSDAAICQVSNALAGPSTDVSHTDSVFSFSVDNQGRSAIDSPAMNVSSLSVSPSLVSVPS